MIFGKAVCFGDFAGRRGGRVSFARCLTEFCKKDENSSFEVGDEIFRQDFSNYMHLDFGGDGEGEKGQDICYLTVTYAPLTRGQRQK